MKPYAKTALHILLIALAITAIFPFVWMFFTTFKTIKEIARYPPTFVPDILTLRNYRRVFELLPVFNLFLNSFMLSVLPAAGSIVLGAAGGFIFAKLEFKGRDLLFKLLLVSMIVPDETRVIPLFLLVRKLHLIDTYLAAVFPSLMGPFSLFLMRQHILQIPKDYLDACVIEGASFFQTLKSVVFPLVRPAAATVAIVAFMWNWRQLLWHLLILETPGKKTLEIAMATFVTNLGGAMDIDHGAYMAFVTVSIIPVLVVFLALQKRFINSLVLSGLKG